MIKSRLLSFRRFSSYFIDAVVLASLLAFIPFEKIAGGALVRHFELVFPAIYFTVFGMTGGTPGKFLLGLRLRAGDGSRVRLAMVLLRYWHYLSVVVIFSVFDLFIDRAKVYGGNVVFLMYLCGFVFSKNGTLRRDLTSNTGYWEKP